MYTFDSKEKESILFFVELFKQHYRSDAIITRVETDKLTEKDLVSLDSKVRTMLNAFTDPSRFNTMEQTGFLLKVGMNASIVLNALSHYRSDSYDPHKPEKSYEQYQQHKKKK